MQRIKQLFDENISHAYYWMKVEISHIKKDRNGHYYLDLVETIDNKIIAKSEARLWNYTAEYIRGEIGGNFDEILQAGQTILCYCKAEFHTVYGLSFVITQLDLSFFLGELERKKQKNVKLLTENGLIHKNKQLRLPLVLQKIALVASPISSGYHDFVQHLLKNNEKYRFQIDVFSTQVQGLQAADEIVNQLNKVDEEQYDVVVILRGGGSKLDLELFNDYNLAKTIALHPLPVLTGIGHETDQTIADLVAHLSLKTPTAIASFIIDNLRDYEFTIQKNYETIVQLYHRKVKEEVNQMENHLLQLFQLSKLNVQNKKQNVNRWANQFVFHTKEKLNSEQRFIENLSYECKHRVVKITQNERKHLIFYKQNIENQVQNIIKNKTFYYKHQKEQLIWLSNHSLKKEKQNIQQWEMIVGLHSIEQTLEKGFAIIKKQGNIITPDTLLEIGNRIEIETKHRKIQATINTVPLWKQLLTKAQQEN